MARIILGLGASHAPQLQLPPELWHLRAEADRRNPALWFRGQAYQFPDLLELRAHEHLEQELDPETAQARFEACQRALHRLSQTLAHASPDIVVIFGDDQHEVFDDRNMPAFCVYWGEQVDDDPEAERFPSAASGSLYRNAPASRVSHPTHAALGRHIIQSLIESGFDVARSNSLPEGRLRGGIGHAFHFIYRRLMNNRVIPHVPIFLNTFYPPNQPNLARCFQLGRAVGAAIRSWDTDHRVAVVASGGLSHFVIEEDLDRQVLEGLQTADERMLTGLPLAWFNSGTSEIRNWIALAGAVVDEGLRMRLIDYVPCYRTEAGTGCAMAFAEWKAGG